MNMHDDAQLLKARIAPTASLKDALKHLDDAAVRILFVCTSDGVLLGSLTDGDVRRAILAGHALHDAIADVYHRTPAYVEDDGLAVRERAREMLLAHSIDALPIVDARHHLIGMLTWQDCFGRRRTNGDRVAVPVVIMAGGRGTRLDPVTSVIPKPLIPIGEKPVVEIILDRFAESGARHFYITLNYRGAMIQAYLANLVKDYRVEYVLEEGYLGTAGSLTLLHDRLPDTFIVSNCDIMVDLDYGDLVRYHTEHAHLLTVVGSLQHHRIPYGVITFGVHGSIRAIEEKPEIDCTINTGVYVLSRAVVERMPKGVPVDMTDVIADLLRRDARVGVYPVSQRSYVDVGQWKEYRQYLATLAERSDLLEHPAYASRSV